MNFESESVLQLEDITQKFTAQTLAVDGVSLKLHRGDLLGLLGPSGCGKTTLLRLIAGFESPYAGSILIDGQLATGEKRCIPPEKRGIGMVFQDYALFPHLNVEDNIAFGLRRKEVRMGDRAIQERIAEVLQLVSLTGLQKRYPHQLSGGQQQRVALARALAPRPALVLLDEPLSNLDVQVRLRLRQELREILKSTGTTAIFVTHDQEEALSVSDWVAVMRSGKIEQFDRPEAIYREPASRFVAEFVTQANFVPAERVGEVWQTELGCVPLPLDTMSDRVEVMLRQEDLILKPDPDSNIIIRDRAFLGREHRYRLQTPSGREIIAVNDAAQALPVGTPVRVAIASPNLRYFPS
ncbi:MAG: ABC transporter ATP-binding protein [Jaaginema sp. PMC 1079.18]|nr:ABC transporter ATP-binding protein [Jaaginema sp. PMC 1080.18]MEC4851020.1 ABC transporter ATP-binding protein [Jaaginema sp. PMC 1079.18]MEC4868023.1 ABC transporter ATP-binding protein [Jaaginema sp. PMC 1078.18]